MRVRYGINDDLDTAMNDTAESIRDARSILRYPCRVTDKNCIDIAN